MGGSIIYMPPTIGRGLVLWVAMLRLSQLKVKGAEYRDPRDASNDADEGRSAPETARRGGGYGWCWCRNVSDMSNDECNIAVGLFAILAGNFYGIIEGNNAAGLILFQAATGGGGKRGDNYVV